eukprot:356206-Chlamydomonas_euryale.AAC.1
MQTLPTLLVRDTKVDNGMDTGITEGTCIHVDGRNFWRNYAPCFSRTVPPRVTAISSGERTIVYKGHGASFWSCLCLACGAFPCKVL